MEYVVATERLGWPETRWWNSVVLSLVQSRLRYEIEPDRPTATCHLQVAVDHPAVCGFEWECLIEVPRRPAWTDLHPDLRCDQCSAAAGFTEEPPMGPYLFDYERPESRRRRVTGSDARPDLPPLGVTPRAFFIFGGSDVIVRPDVVQAAGFMEPADVACGEYEAVLDDLGRRYSFEIVAGHALPSPEEKASSSFVLTAFESKR